MHIGGWPHRPPCAHLWGSPIDAWSLQVSNRGQSVKTLGSAFLTLLWPHELPNGKWLLYPLHIELVAAPGQAVPCSPAANPLRLALVWPRLQGCAGAHLAPGAPAPFQPLPPTGTPGAAGAACTGGLVGASARREEEERHIGEKGEPCAGGSRSWGAPSYGVSLLIGCPYA